MGADARTGKDKRMSKAKITWYVHHDWSVWVREDLKGRHRDYCLCHRCAKLRLDSREHNCPIANLLYAVCCAHGLTTPVFECPLFIERPA